MVDSTPVSFQGILKIMTWTVTLMFVISPAAVISQSVEITSSTISSGDVVCPGEEGIFTCEAREGSAIVWTGDEYITDQLQNSVLDSGNVTVRDPVNRNTVATFEISTEVIVSQLQIVVLRIPLAPSITCALGSNTAINAIVGFQVLGDPGVPQVTAEFETNTCTISISVVPLSIAVGDIDHFVISINGDNQTISGSETSLSHPVRSCAESHNVRAGILTRCGFMGQFSPVITVGPDPSCEESICNGTTSSMTSSMTSSATDSPPSSPSGISAGIVVAIVVPITALIVLALVVVGVIIWLWCYTKTRPPKSVGDMKLQSKNVPEDEEK